MPVARFVAALTALALIAAPAAHAQQGDDVLAPARQGDLQCYAPNAQAKTCAALAAYAFDAQGKITNTGDVVIYPNPVIVMHMTSPVEVRSGAVCGPLRQEDVSQATFTIDGQAAPEAETQTIRTQFAQQAASLIGVDICTTYTPTADGAFRADATVGGTPHPEMTQTVIWVHPSDGYHAAP